MSASEIGYMTLIAWDNFWKRQTTTHIVNQPFTHTWCLLTWETSLNMFPKVKEWRMAIVGTTFSLRAQSKHAPCAYLNTLISKHSYVRLGKPLWQQCRHLVSKDFRNVFININRVGCISSNFAAGSEISLGWSYFSEWLYATQDTNKSY